MSTKSLLSLIEEFAAHEKNNTLGGKEAIVLWQLGSDTWNRWVDNHREWNINFRGVDFDKYRSIPLRHALIIKECPYHAPVGEDLSCKAVRPIPIVFENFRFPSGSIDFTFATFGDGDVSFSRSVFANGSVDFNLTDFGSGNTDFSEAQFLDCTIDFYRSFFRNGTANFSGAVFSGKDVRFQKAKFINTTVDFENTCFETEPNRHVDFSDAVFGGATIFTGANFKSGNVNFHLARFAGDLLMFEHVYFGDGIVSFDHAEFDGVGILFNNSHFGRFGVSFNDILFRDGFIFQFDEIHCAGKFRFSPSDNSVYCSITVDDASFDKAVSLMNVAMREPVDFRHARLSIPPVLDEIRIREVPYERHHGLFKRAIVSGHSSSFRYMKKLAKDAENYAFALDCYANEMRSSYWHSLNGTQLVLFYLYDWLSDYGRSLRRPIIALLTQWGLYAMTYWSGLTAEDGSIREACILSLAYTAPLYAGANDARQRMLSELFPTVPDWLHLLSISQGLLSSVCLFLIVLALRNRLRS